MERFIIGGTIGIVMWATNLFLHNNKLNSGDCYATDREYCVIKLVDDGFYNIECTYDNESRKALFFSLRKRYYEVDFSMYQIKCPRNIKDDGV